MLKNWNHDLVKQLSEVSSSLWRMDEYMKNAKECEHCTKMWKEAQGHLEKISQMLVQEIGRHHKEDRFE